MVPYSSIKAEINLVDTFYVLNHINGKSLIFRLDKFNSIDIKNIIEYGGSYFSTNKSDGDIKIGLQLPFES